MSTLPVNAIYSGILPDGHWAGAPTLIIQLMDHPATDRQQTESLDGLHMTSEWPLDPANEVSLNKMLSRRAGIESPHFARIGASTLAMLVTSYNEPHVMFIGREPGRHDLAPLVTRLLESGRSVQIEAIVLSASLAIPLAWITLLSLPSRTVAPIDPAPAASVMPNEVLACIRWKADLDRAELIYARSSAPVWLRPTASAEEGMYRQCVAVATRHAGWRVMPNGGPLVYARC